MKAVNPAGTSEKLGKIPNLNKQIPNKSQIQKLNNRNYL